MIKICCDICEKELRSGPYIEVDLTRHFKRLFADPQEDKYTGVICDDCVDKFREAYKCQMNKCEEQ